jgi:hypothetical protein
MNQDPIVVERRLVGGAADMDDGRRSAEAVGRAAADTPAIGRNHEQAHLRHREVAEIGGYRPRACLYPRQHARSVEAGGAFGEDNVDDAAADRQPLAGLLRQRRVDAFAVRIVGLRSGQPGRAARQRADADGQRPASDQEMCLPRPCARHAISEARWRLRRGVQCA